MPKELNYLLFLLLLCVSCEEYYYPVMDTMSGRLVVEAQITNDLSKNNIHITKTRSFYDVLPPLEVTGATVSLVELGTKNIIRGAESSSGHYVLPSAPESGKKYYLRIVVQNETYESAAVTMPPVPTVNKIYSEYLVKTVFVNTANNDPQTFDYPGREIYADIPLNSSLSHFRFKVKNLIEWSWDPNPAANSLYPAAYGWYTYTDNQQFLLAAPKDFNQTANIDKYHLLTLSYNPFTYLFSDTLVSHGNIVMIEQYGTSKESYDFHTQLNSQFGASGSLFDPVQTQIEGNMLCTTTPSEKVYGYFDLNSFQEYRFYYFMNPPPGKYLERQIFRFPVIPSSGKIFAPQKTKAEPYPPAIQKPDWWEE